MTQLNGAEAMVRMLQLNGVKHIFGLCGDTSLPFCDALQRLDHGMEHILTRDERSAAYMADAYARVTGKVGVCEGPAAAAPPTCCRAWSRPTSRRWPCWGLLPTYRWARAASTR